MANTGTKRVLMMMWLMTLLASSTAALFGATGGSEESGSKVQAGLPELVLVACEVRLSEIGRRSSFQGSAIFSSESDAMGSLSQLNAVHVPSFFDTMLVLSDFSDCLKSWRLLPEKDYTVELSAGAVGDLIREWSISVCSNPEEPCIVLKLPRLRTGVDSYRSDVEKLEAVQAGEMKRVFLDFLGESGYPFDQVPKVVFEINSDENMRKKYEAVTSIGYGKVSKPLDLGEGHR